MKIATYNIWDSNAGMPVRFGQIIDEIAATKADIICLQEVSDREKCDSLSKKCGYDNSHWQAQAGLSVLSRYPIEKTYDFEYGTSACIQSDSKTLLIINVHLPWEKASLREKAIVDIIEKADSIKADYTLLMGDFNCSENSSVHRFLTNEQSLLGADAYYFDLAEVYAEISGTKASSTLDFRKNPRWGTAETKNTIEVSQRVDRILLKNPFPVELPELKNCVIFGSEVLKETGLAASDHYGVVAEIEF
ncbi:MAG: endonuclease/exonuclease/phosphatase family protein [Oscillospiraceae bacterium]|nr:endonuclease/exonuclease/phosphatase family protein [Oscillospiraceae bacterium]